MAQIPIEPRSNNFEPIGNEHLRRNPIPPKRGSAWPIWLLAIVALVGLLGWLFNSDNRRDDDRASTVITDQQRDDNLYPGENTRVRYSENDDANNGALTRATNPDTDQITDLNQLVIALDKTQFIGDEADLQKVKVRRVLSDRIFTIANSNTPELFVIMDNDLNNNNIDANVQIRPGQTLNVNGKLSEINTSDIESEQQHGLEPAEMSELQQQRVYLRADEISAQQ